MQTKLIQSQELSPSQQPIRLTVIFHTILLCSVEAQSFRIVCKAAIFHPYDVFQFSVIPEVIHCKWHLVRTGGAQYWFQANNVKVHMKLIYHDSSKYGSSGVIM
jgi:hypothetical protein